jgi:methylated-DNA-[protein]-cysteine S-methyltransferase
LAAVFGVKDESSLRYGKVKYAVFSTGMGYIGIVFGNHKPEPVAIKIYLPGSESLIERTIKREYPAATEISEALPRLCSLVSDFLGGNDVRFPFELVDSSVCYAFQLKVLKAEREIPRGTVAAYSWVAKRIGSGAVRAVGSALARNPFPIVVPCHRAVRSDGSLGGFQGGLEMKRKLLELEGVQFDSRGHVTSSILRP